MARIPKPGVRRTTHLFLSPFLWSVIGCVLIYRGWNWLGRGSGRLLVLVALVIGSLKGYFVLDKTAARYPVCGHRLGPDLLQPSGVAGLVAAAP